MTNRPNDQSTKDYKEIDHRIGGVAERWAVRVSNRIEQNAQQVQRNQRPRLVENTVTRTRTLLANTIQARLEDEHPSSAHVDDGVSRTKSLVIARRSSLSGLSSQDKQSGENQAPIKEVSQVHRFGTQPVPADGQQGVHLDHPSSIDEAGGSPALPQPVKRIIERTPQHRLDGQTERILSRSLDVRIPTVRLYVNQAADEVVRQQGADAVTYGENILFRTDKFVPETPEGMGLLGHEITHALQSQQSPVPDEPRQPAVVRQQEAVALQNEQRVRATIMRPKKHSGYATLPPVGQQTPPEVGSNASMPSLETPSSALTSSTVTSNTVGTRAATAPVTSQGQAAASDRNVMGGSPGTVSLSHEEMQRIKDEVYADLLARIRVEHERGA